MFPRDVLKFNSCLQKAQDTSDIKVFLDSEIQHLQLYSVKKAHIPKSDYN